MLSEVGLDIGFAVMIGKSLTNYLFIRHKINILSLLYTTWKLPLNTKSVKFRRHPTIYAVTFLMTWHPYRSSFYEYLRYICEGGGTLGIGSKICFTCLIWLLILIGHLYMSTCGLPWLQERRPKKHVLKRDWTPCSKHDNHSKLK